MYNLVVTTIIVLFVRSQSVSTEARKSNFQKIVIVVRMMGYKVVCVRALR